MTSVIANLPKFQFFDNNGHLAAGYKLYTYLAGTTTPATTWQDQGQGSANTNPITLDARGECLLWLDPRYEYKLVLKTAAGATIWTQDDVRGPISPADYQIDVVSLGADTTGVASSVAAFQAAIDSTSDGTIQVIHVPRGTYLGDMTTLTYGSRTVVWQEEGGVTYSTAAPTANRVNAKVGSDSTRPWFYGSNGFTKDVTDGSSTDRPVVRVQRVANHTGGTILTSAISANTTVNNTGGRVDNYESVFTGQFDSYRAATTGSPNFTVMQGTMLKHAASTGGFFGNNYVARDETKLGTVNSKGSLVASELDVVASGPDTTESRIGLDVVMRGYDASADGATSMYAGIRVRPANSGVLSAEPVNLLNGILVDPGTLGTIATGISVTGAASAAHIEILGATSGVMKVGGQNSTNGNTVGQINITGYNSSSAKVNYANITSTIGSNTAGSENGTLLLQTRRAGSLTTEIGMNGGAIIGNPTGTYKGTGSLNLAAALYSNGTQVVSARDTGWTAMTGSSDKATAYATSTVTLAQLAGRVMALQAALTTHGLIGA